MFKRFQIKGRKARKKNGVFEFEQVVEGKKKDITRIENAQNWYSYLGVDYEFEWGVFNDAADKAMDVADRRPWLAKAFDDNVNRYDQHAKQLMIDFQEIKYPRGARQRRIRGLAMMFVHDAQDVVSGWPSDNAKATVKSKGFNKGLEEQQNPANKKYREDPTTPLLASITWRKVK